MYDNYISTFDEFLEKGNLFTVSIQTLCIELYNVYNNFSETIFRELFVRYHSNYSLLPQSDFVIPEVKTVMKGPTDFGTLDLLSGI